MTGANAGPARLLRFERLWVVWPSSHPRGGGRRARVCVAHTTRGLVLVGLWDAAASWAPPTDDALADAENWYRRHGGSGAWAGRGGDQP